MDRPENKQALRRSRQPCRNPKYTAARDSIYACIMLSQSSATRLSPPQGALTIPRFARDVSQARSGAERS